MNDPYGDVDRLLYDGEGVVETVTVGAGRVVVTTHRLLALTPEGDGANVRVVNRPNVDAVDLKTDGNGRYLRWTLRPLVLGGLLLVAGTQLEIGDPLSSVDTSGAGRTGAGGVLSTATEFTSLLSVLDDLMLAAGAGCLLIVALLLGLYLYTRERSVVVAVAGDDDLALPVGDSGRETVTRLETALAGGDTDVPGTPDDSTASGSEPQSVEDLLSGSAESGRRSSVSAPDRSNAGDEGK